MRPDTPRRLVYCLPMRVLVEQSERAANRWIANLGLAHDVPVHVLMGGVEGTEWYLHPERPAVLIGTQDMLLSRALNRGYAASRFHWPIDFGLLNNDCLWVFDEPQLMGNGVATSAQLAGLRKLLGTVGPCPSVWMSATLEPTWLDTVDFRGKFTCQTLELGRDQYGDDYDPQSTLLSRMTANKTLAPLGASFTREADDREAKAVAGKILEKHREVPDAQTLVVLNTVRRAKRVYEALMDLRRRSKTAFPNLLLVHSRFRPHEREQLNDRLQEAGPAARDRIIVATQVVEAGVDISAHTLVTELAPWASLVQRIGRCNRTGNESPGRVFWIDLDHNKQAAPYEPSALAHARLQLERLEGQDVSPRALDEFKTKNNIILTFEHTHVVRRRDVLDLFDTSPDLSGNDIDVSRFVRSDEPDTDVRIFWRRWEGFAPPRDLPAPRRQELCPVPIGSELRDFLERIREKKKLYGYFWDHLDEDWVRLDHRQLRPGITILLPSQAGGYSDLGWDVGSGEPVEPLPSSAEPEDAESSDPRSSGPGPALTIADHTDNVCRELDSILKVVSLPGDEWRIILEVAARWHDAGKAHPIFQASVHRANPDLPRSEFWAKSGVLAPLRHERKYFRHELASALAAIQNDLPFEAAYLIMAHHGKVRVSIRALPGENPPGEPDTLFALGIYHGECLPAVNLGSSTCPTTQLDLSPMQLGGGGSWTARALKLRDALGPFRLAYLEALLRAGDLRASAKERGGQHA